MLAAASQGARYIYIIYNIYYLQYLQYLKHLQEPQPAPIVIELPGETGPEYTCPGDGTFPDMESGCEQYYVCNQGKVRPQDRTHLREVSQCPEKAPARAFSLLKAN